MPTIAQLKQQVDRICYASFQTNLTDTLATQLRRHALAGVKAALETALVEELGVSTVREQKVALATTITKLGSCKEDHSHRIRYRFQHRDAIK